MVGGVADTVHGLLCSSLDDINWLLITAAPRNDFPDESLPYPVHRVIDTRRLGDRSGDAFALTRKANSLIWRAGCVGRARALVRHVTTEGVQLALVACWGDQVSYWCQASRELKLPYAVMVHGLELTQQLPCRQTQRRRDDLLGASRIAANTRVTARIAVSLGVDESRITVITPAVDPDSLRPLPADRMRAILGRHGLEENRYILFVGRLVRRKGADLLLDAFARLGSVDSAKCLAIVGDGPERSCLEEIARALGIAARVVFLGGVGLETKRALLQGCTLFASPNRPLPGDMEGFGIVFVEAGFFGKACVGGRDGGVPEAVLHEETGLLADTAVGAQPVRATIARLLQDDGLRNRLGENARRRVLREFTWTCVGTRYVALFHDMLDAREGRPPTGSARLGSL